MATPFHLAINVTDLRAARAFYGGVMGCSEGRSADTWVDFDFFGHRLSLHLGEPFATAPTEKLETRKLPTPHFGVVLALRDWRKLARRLEQAATRFIVPPSVRFAGQPAEQWTMFFADPDGNPIEVRGFADLAEAAA